ncbi:YceI family protein [Luteolibacter sp. SL250]|uniref:YceI family protein n=1 Tax=Luteolibacter sp. SL250 TaxID=2995170 RepID=UPI0022709600|nr:YceI family protein [Luteolibacter sp. SL250]WAC21742.1 YceI family protein [Luteolibacter sp. SL250]
MASSPSSTLIDVLSADSYEAEHVPGAVNLCVYETAFIDKVKQAFPDTATALTVCGYCDSTKEAEVAVARLEEAGYTDVSVLSGGLEKWKADGGTPEGKGDAAASSNGKLAVDPEASSIHWTGRNLFNFHTGSLKLAGGCVEIRDGVLVAGEIHVDMDSLACTDLTDTAMNRMLVDHLRSDDFFSIGDHPVATFTVVSATRIDGVSDGLPNHCIEGNLTLRGKVIPVSFDALVARKDDGSYVAQAMVDFDRTQWGSIYGSGRFFSRLGQHVVNDVIHLHLKVVTVAG